jgi:hypothetical protein
MKTPVVIAIASAAVINNNVIISLNSCVILSQYL